ncbi:hypothetical protein QQ045_007937 [Rhodiola kirilowii]
MKAGAMAEGKPSDFFNHLKSAADSLSALAWIAYTGKDCGKRYAMDALNFSEGDISEVFIDSFVFFMFVGGTGFGSFLVCGVLVEYKGKDPNHVEAMKELYVPGLRDYVKSHYPLGPVWNASGKAHFSDQKMPGPPTPPPPSASVFTASSSAVSSSAQPKAGMSAVFQEISSKPLTAGESLEQKVTDDMQTKNRTDRTGVVGTSEKEAHARAISNQKTGPPKLELQMGRKWVVENQIGNKNLVIDDCDPKQSVYIYGCKDSVLQVQDRPKCRMGKSLNKQLISNYRMWLPLVKL